MKKGLAGRTFKSESESKSKSKAFKSKSTSESLEPKSESKSSKNGLKSGLESKSGLEYYKSAPHYCGCGSFSTWWAIMGQYKDVKEIQDLDHC